MLNIRVGGVPEHFNLPWHLALENGLFESENINVEWKTSKER
jgi:ABC-type nitrate/sulfonate/bicarbonate transport system substrate-binding protein